MKRLVALGDSHLEALEFASQLGLLDAATCSFRIVPGATAVGLRNPNALTNAVNIFKDALVNEPRDSHVLIHLGEVDCGFVIWWRAKKYAESVESQFLASIDAYGGFLDDVAVMGFRKLCVTGASLPTIRDGTHFGEVANKRAEIDVGLRERTDLTLRYNHELRLLADKKGFEYLDISDAVLDRNHRLVHEFFRNQDPADHHLDKQKVVGIWAALGNRFLSPAAREWGRDLGREMRGNQ